MICDGLRGDLIARGIAADKIIVSPNGVDLTLFGDAAAARRRAGRRARARRAPTSIGFIGSFYDYEGLDDLIAAMPALVAARPDGAAAAGRRRADGGGAARAGRGVAGRRTRSASSAACRMTEVERYYSLIDILAYPRKPMRLTDLVTPLKPLEAMAQRRLVAASDVGGHRELIRDGDTGTLFAPDDPAAIAAALAGLFADRTRLGRAARAGARLRRARS